MPLIAIVFSPNPIHAPTHSPTAPAKPPMEFDSRPPHRQTSPMRRPVPHPCLASGSFYHALHAPLESHHWSCTSERIRSPRPRSAPNHHHTRCRSAGEIHPSCRRSGLQSPIRMPARVVFRLHRHMGAGGPLWRRVPILPPRPPRRTWRIHQINK